MITGQVTEDRRMESCRQGESRRLYDQDERLRNEPCLEPKHKIFLSNSGAQKNFTEQLCKDLERVNHFPFFDKRSDCLPIGEHFPSLIIKAAKQCRLAIVVLSEEFFTRSKWPMIELSEVVQAKASKNSDVEILPLFLGITIAEFNSSAKRKSWERGWQGWQYIDGRIDVKKWVHALSVLDGLNGMEYDAAVGEVTYREEVLAAVSELIPPDIKWDVSHVQSTAKLCEPILRKMHEVGVPLCNGARVVGLYGTGGVGKTTIAKVLWIRKFKEFAGKVCLVELGPDKALAKSLKIVLRVLNEEVNAEILPNEEGKLVSLFKERMHRHRVFLVLDNVSENQVGEALTFLEGKFKQGSIVLVISRSLGILQRLHIRDGDCIEMPDLDKEGATNLFLFRAECGLPQPLGCSRLEAIDRCVEWCRFWKRDLGRETCTPHYHPLTLRVVGRQLGTVSNDPLQWDKLSKDHLFNVLRGRGDPIFRGLRVGYDSLPPREQPIFLDLALNVVPRSARYTKSVWDWLSSTHGSSRDQIKESLQSIWRKGLIEDVREDGLLTIKIHELFVEFAEQEVQDVWGNWPFVFDVGRSDVPESLWRIPQSLVRPPARLVIRNSNLRSLKEVDSRRIRKVKALQILDCQLLEELDVQGMVELRGLEIFGCPRLGEKFQGLAKLTNLVWLSWKDVPKSVPVTSHLSSLPSLQFVDLGFRPHS